MVYPIQNIKDKGFTFNKNLGVFVWQRERFILDLASWSIDLKTKTKKKLHTSVTELLKIIDEIAPIYNMKSWNLQTLKHIFGPLPFDSLETVTVLLRLRQPQRDRSRRYLWPRRETDKGDADFHHRQEPPWGDNVSGRRTPRRGEIAFWVGEERSERREKEGKEEKRRNQQTHFGLVEWRIETWLSRDVPSLL